MADLTYETQEAVPEDLREFAQSKDGKFIVSVAPQSKLTEFRDNNISISKERDTANGLIAKLRTDIGFDPEKYEEFKTSFDDLRTTKQQVEDGKLVKDSSLDDAVQKRTTQMQRDHAEQLRSVTTVRDNLVSENNDLKVKLDNMELDQWVSAAALDKRSGIRPDAVEAVLDAARKVFKRRDGKFIPLDQDGNVMYGSDGTSPMKPLEWIKAKLTTRMPYLFLESSGGGSEGGRGGDTTSLMNLPPAERMRAAREQQAGR